MAEGIDDADALFVHELIGEQVVDQHGNRHGVVTSVLANPASDLLELADGRLIPMVFVRGHADGVISVDVPAGLLDDSEISG
jgi:16S rRNA processing protein RimM